MVKDLVLLHIIRGREYFGTSATDFLTADFCSSESPITSFWSSEPITVRSHYAPLRPALLLAFGSLTPLLSHHKAIRLFKAQFGVNVVCSNVCWLFGHVLCPASSHFWIDDRSYVCKIETKPAKIELERVNIQKTMVGLWTRKSSTIQQVNTRQNNVI